MSLQSKFSLELYHARHERHYTQEQVAEAVSISLRWYQHLEKGTFLPGSVTMLRLILFLEMDIELFREEVGLVDPISLRTR